MTDSRDEVRARALHALLCPDVEQKLALTMDSAARTNSLSVAPTAPSLPDGASLPGRPERPALVPPAQVPRRNPNRPEGLAALLHAVAHIEFNAINLALDAAWRFDGMPAQFHRDWLRVAGEEAQHFSLLRERLQALGFDYGDFDAHDGLWQMCAATAGDPLARMALVPRTLEARGLDATPLMQERLRRVGSPEALAAVRVLDVILRDEVGHVAIGNHWYHWLCARDGQDPRQAAQALAQAHGAPRLRGPFNVEARRSAGFSREDLQALD